MLHLITHFWPRQVCVCVCVCVFKGRKNYLIEENNNSLLPEK